MLIKSDVVFDPEYHKYYLGHRELKGITGVISRYLFPNKYSNVPKRILDAAKERGSAIHKACEMYNIFPVVYDDTLLELRNYVKLLDENGIEPLEAEYIVSNNETHATAIDMVDLNHNIYDIKTTSMLDKSYLSWQLSICAHFFELQNPGVNAGKLYAIWLKDDKSKLIEVDRIPSEIVASLLEADSQNAEWTNPIVTDEIAIPDEESMIMLESAIVEMETRLNEYKELKKDFEENIKEYMISLNLSKLESDRIRITYVAPTQTTTFNGEQFKADYPETYAKYIKTSPRKGYIKTTLL